MSVELKYPFEGEEPITWRERHLIVHSLQHPRSPADALHTRLVKAQAELGNLLERKQGKERIENAVSLHKSAEAIIKQHPVEGLLH